MKILFICHGNICQSPMAEYVMKDLVHQEGLESQFTISSCATSTEEIGSDMHPGTKKILQKYHIPYGRHYARQLTKNDYQNYDLLVCMDQSNRRNALRILAVNSNNKIQLLLDHDIRDPWYTGDFQETYDDILLGCEKLLTEIKKNL